MEEGINILIEKLNEDNIKNLICFLENLGHQSSEESFDT